VTRIAQVLITTTRQVLNDAGGDTSPAAIAQRQDAYRHALSKGQRAVKKASLTLNSLEGVVVGLNGNAAWLVLLLRLLTPGTLSQRHWMTRVGRRFVGP